MSNDEHCVSGCRIYSGHERKHHKDCPHYPESFSKRFDLLQAENTELQKNLEVWREACGNNEKRIEELQAKNKRLKELLKYPLKLPVTAGDYDENVKWAKEVEQALKG